MSTSTWAHPPLLRASNFLRILKRFPHLGEARPWRRAPPRAEPIASRRSADPGLPGVGDVLRQARQDAGHSLGRISTALRIRPEHILSIEAGAYAELPAPAYAIGFIRSYAAHLGLDGAEMVRRFKRETEGQHLGPELAMPMPESERRVSPGAFLVGVAILGVCGYVGWHSLQSGEPARSERVEAVPAALLTPPGSLAPAAAVAAAEPAALSALSPAAGPSPVLAQGRSTLGTTASAPALEAKAPP
ncbi:MAG: helix-turn-helix domain-containing protein, partial [Stellaceae bacterium]